MAYYSAMQLLAVSRLWFELLTRSLVAGRKPSLGCTAGAIPGGGALPASGGTTATSSASLSAALGQVLGDP